MNWDKIEKDCPKAIKKLYEYNDLEMEERGEIKYVLLDIYFGDRDLYDFFDKQKVFVSVGEWDSDDWFYGIDVMTDVSTGEYFNKG